MRQRDKRQFYIALCFILLFSDHTKTFCIHLHYDFCRVVAYRMSRIGKCTLKCAHFAEAKFHFLTFTQPMHRWSCHSRLPWHSSRISELQRAGVLVMGSVAAIFIVFGDLWLRRPNQKQSLRGWFPWGYWMRRARKRGNYVNQKCAI